jgi:hypothetical protein
MPITFAMAQPHEFKLTIEQLAYLDFACRPFDVAGESSREIICLKSSARNNYGDFLTAEKFLGSSRRNGAGTTLAPLLVLGARSIGRK